MTTPTQTEVIEFLRQQENMWQTIAGYCPPGSQPATEDQKNAAMYRHAINLIESVNH